MDHRDEREPCATRQQRREFILPGGSVDAESREPDASTADSRSGETDQRAFDGEEPGSGEIMIMTYDTLCIVL